MGGGMARAILDRVLAGAYAQAYDLYAHLSAPSAVEDRLAGVCLFNLRRLPESRDLLLRARARGCHAAGIELATVYRHLGQLALAAEAIDGADGGGLPAFDRALALRERGAQRYTAGALGEATDAFERAWAEAHAASDGTALLAAIGQALGHAYADRGLDARAVCSFEAALAHANPPKAVYLRASRALSLIHGGAYEAAERDLAAAIAALVHVPLAAPYLAYLSGELQRALGRPAEAAERFAAAARLAAAAHEIETEAYAELGLGAVAVAGDDLEAARRHLARARLLSPGAKVMALVGLREGTVVAREGDRAALDRLAEAERAFRDLGLVRERAWAWLHLADAHLRLDDVHGARAALAAAVAARYALGGQASLQVELRSAPRVLAFVASEPHTGAWRALADDARRIAVRTPARLELRSLGRSELLLDGAQVRFDLRRSHEVLAYALRHPGASLERILTDLFGDEDVDTARNYFHQVRYELGRRIARLAVPFDRQAKTYAVRLDGIELEWDVAALRGALARGGERGLHDALACYGGPFLPHAQGEWAREEREDLAWSIVQVGIAVMQTWQVSGAFDKCVGAALRLLEIEPYNETIVEMLMTSTQALEGDAAAQHVGLRHARRFKADLGVIPAALARLRLLN
jgi:DNA-binding SARP family transcriptional activator